MCSMVPQQPRRRRRRAALPRIAERRITVLRGAGGFGFTIAGQRPCVVSAVAAGGPAERAGLRAGDALLAVDGASVARAPHASVARLVAAAPGAIALSVAPRETPPTDTEDTEPDERARTRRRHPPPRRRPQPVMHHPGCHAAPSTSGVNAILQNLSRVQLAPSHAARLECRAVVGYLGTIETPQAASPGASASVRSAVRKLRQERRPATPVLLSVLPNVLLLRRPTGQLLAHYPRERILHAGCGSDNDTRYFGLVTAAEMPDETSHSCHVFAVDPRMAEHEAHSSRAREFQITCTRDAVAERCLEFPPTAEYVVGVIRGMFSLPPDEYASPTLQQISKLAVRGDPGLGNFSRCNRAVFRVARDRRGCRHEDAHVEGQEYVANSPTSEVTSSNSDSGIGFNHHGINMEEKVLLVDFAGQQPPPNRFRQEIPRRPMGLVGCSSFDADGFFLSNTTPVVDDFGGQGRPLNLDDAVELQPVRHMSPRNEEDNYNYNNLPSTSRSYQVPTEAEDHYELLPQMDLEMERVANAFNSLEIYENVSVDNVSVSERTASADCVSVYSSRSHEEARPARRRHLQASLDDMLVLGNRDQPPQNKDDATFLHPASVKCKVRKSKPLNILSRTRNMLTGKDREKERRRAISASAGDVTGDKGDAEEGDALPAAASEPDLRDTQSEQSSPFRRWTTGGGSGSSYRHTDHRALFNKQMSEGAEEGTSSGSRGQWPNGGVARWALGLNHLLADPIGVAAFTAFLKKEFASENIKFYLSCETYSRTEDPEKRAILAREIWERHLSDGAPEPINIDAGARRATMSRVGDSPPPELFAQAQRQVFNVMRLDPYPRFLRSAVHAECARADLLGQPSPYQESTFTTNTTGQTSSSRDMDDLEEDYGYDADMSETYDTASTASCVCVSCFQYLFQLCCGRFCKPSKNDAEGQLKKSASNASERRRSGGPSLLPWRLRVPSRERAVPGPAVPPVSAAVSPSVSTAVADQPGLGSNQPPAAVPGQSNSGPGDSTAPITDFVKSGGFCRVQLPDGATSVGEVKRTISVGDLVGRMLVRHNLLAANYDVLFKDARPGEPSVIDVHAPSTILGGREVAVERRCVVRMEVAGRCVAVRCRPERRLRHVLRPVLARYAPASSASAPRAVLRDGCVLHPDTTMQDLDDARLQIVELCDTAAECACDDDADSLSDLAVRLQDEHRNDDQSNSAQVDASSPSRVLVASATAAASAALGSSSGRVRAALRAGPPLHHHPPDFLENLRETQRQRSQSRNPRTPPPLPPKPRAPTLV